MHLLYFLKVNKGIINRNNTIILWSFSSCRKRMVIAIRFIEIVAVGSLILVTRHASTHLGKIFIKYPK